MTPDQKRHDRAQPIPDDSEDARIFEILEGVLELEPHERNGFLNAQCGSNEALKEEIKKLLEEESQSSWLDRGAFLNVEEKDPPMPSVDRYSILHELGSGGMGTVYLAERNDGHFQHQVALKILNRGWESHTMVERFQFERQTLANLNHEHIATLIDGGVTEDGRPYFVMQLVEGMTLDSYCTVHKPSLDKKLILFQKVCDAVHYAHTHRVIHGDIKPSNIMVTEEGTPILLDFGVAKFKETAPSTLNQDEFLPLTPNYASPEQIEGLPITTATDIHALGILLFEMLAGQVPFPISSKPVHTWRQELLSTEPPSLRDFRIPEMGRRARRAFQGDLDQMIRRALQKNPRARYASAEAFSKDLWRYQQHLPIHAREPSMIYILGKWIRRRHRLASASALLLLVLFTSLFLLFTQAQEITRSRTHASQTSAILFEVFENEDPYRGDKKQPTQALIHLAAAQLDQAWISPQQRADLYDALGKAHFYKGEHHKTRKYLEKAYALRSANSMAKHSGMAKTFYHLGLLAMAEQQWPEAEIHFNQALHLLEKAPPGLYPTAEKVQYKRLTLLMYQGQWEAAAQLAQTFSGQTFEASPQWVEMKLVIQAENYASRGSLSEAESTFRTLLKKQTERLPDDHPLLGATWNNLGRISYQRGAYPRAIAAYSQAAEHFRKALGDHPDVATALKNLADGYLASGACTRAASIYREALRIRKLVFGPDHRLVAECLARLQSIFRSNGDLHNAMDLGEQLWGISEWHFGSLESQTLGILMDLMHLACEAKDASRQAAYAREMLVKIEAIYGHESLVVAEVLVKNARLDLQRGAWGGATESLWRAYEIYKEKGQPEQQLAIQKLYFFVAMSTFGHAETQDMTSNMTF